MLLCGTLLLGHSLLGHVLSRSLLISLLGHSLLTRVLQGLGIFLCRLLLLGFIDRPSGGSRCKCLRSLLCGRATRSRPGHGIGQGEL